MKIDIDKLTEAELVDLNNRIVERLRFLTHMRTHDAGVQDRRSRVVSTGRPSDPGWHAHALQQEDNYGHHRQRSALEPGPRILTSAGAGRPSGRRCPKRDPAPQEVMTRDCRTTQSRGPGLAVLRVETPPAQPDR